MSRVLVTGGAGFIGSHLVDELVRQGHAIVVLDDFSTGRRDNLVEASRSGAVRVIEGSVLDRAVIGEAMTDCDMVFHLAVQCVRRSLGRPLENHEINATGTLNVLEAARTKAVRRFVYCSSSEVYGNASDGVLAEDIRCAPVTVYGAAKLAGEFYVLAYWQTYGLAAVVVRPFNSYGPREHEQGDLAEVIPRFVIRALSGKRPIIFGDGTQGRDFTYVDDTAHGLARAGREDVPPGTIVNLGRGELTTIREVAEAVLSACGRNDLGVEHRPGRPGDVFRLTADTRRARELLGFAAELDFFSGLRRYLEWFRAVHTDPSALIEDRLENWTMPER